MTTKNTKSKYVIPVVAFEDFELTAKIAGVCKDDFTDNLRTWGYFNITQGENICDFNVADEKFDNRDYYKICYHTLGMAYDS